MPVYYTLVLTLVLFASFRRLLWLLHLARVELPCHCLPQQRKLCFHAQIWTVALLHTGETMDSITNRLSIMEYIYINSLEVAVRHVIMAMSSLLH